MRYDGAAGPEKRNGLVYENVDGVAKDLKYKRGFPFRRNVASPLEGMWLLQRQCAGKG